AVERGGARERGTGPLAVGEAVADLLELLHRLAGLAEEGQAVADLELGRRRGVARRVLERDLALGLHRIGETAGLPVDEAGSVDRLRHPVAPRVEPLHPSELGQVVAELGPRP